MFAMIGLVHPCFSRTPGWCRRDDGRSIFGAAANMNHAEGEGPPPPSRKPAGSVFNAASRGAIFSEIRNGFYCDWLVAANAGRGRRIFRDRVSRFRRGLIPGCFSVFLGRRNVFPLVDTGSIWMHVRNPNRHSGVEEAPNQFAECRRRSATIHYCYYSGGGR